MSNCNDIMHGRHCVSSLNVHLVFISKHRRGLFDADAIERLRAVFGKVCTDFDAVLVEMDGGQDHVHLLVEYPQLEGCVRSSATQRAPRHSAQVLERGSVVALLLRLIVRRRTYLHPPPVHRGAANTALAPEGRHACAILPRPERRGLSRDWSNRNRGFSLATTTPENKIPSTARATMNFLKARNIIRSSSYSGALHPVACECLQRLARPHAIHLQRMRSAFLYT